MRKRRCCISIPLSASTAARACPFARCRPSSPWTISRKSGHHSPSATQSISDDSFELSALSHPAIGKSRRRTLIADGRELKASLLSISPLLHYNQTSTCWATMALKESEAIVLRTYPLRESDLLVTLFTRMEGKVKGVARAAMKSRRRFGGALEPLTYVRAFYDDREGQELARLDSCEVIESPMASEVRYPAAAALAHVAVVLDELMPDREASDAVFRLSVAVLQELRRSVVWVPLA